MVSVASDYRRFMAFILSLLRLCAMDILKKIPIKYVGELHEVRLINFSVEKDEVLPLVPDGLKVRDFKGRALISMVNVKLRNMRPSFLPKAMHFDYQHIGFRLLIDDSQHNEGPARGIHFLRSFTDNTLMVFGGGVFTNYNLEEASISDYGQTFELRQYQNYLQYNLLDKTPPVVDEELMRMVGALDRAYSFIDGELVKVQIMRERWPIEWITCESFKTNYFHSARFEGAFQVREVIHYEWLPPQKLNA